MLYKPENDKFIFEKVFVETDVDTDQDGKQDLIAVYIRRPAEGKVPAVYVANPYMMTCNEEWYVPHDVNVELKAYPQQDIEEKDVRFSENDIRKYSFSEERQTKGNALQSPCMEEIDLDCISDLYMHLNELGYASVFCAGLGSRGSEGLTLTGSTEEICAFKSVVDWLCGRKRAFTNKTDNIEIKAHWCTGKVAMSAKSYLGTLCIGVAATGVEGLETIIPEAGICSYYDYYRYGGLAVPAIEWQGDDLDILARYCFSRAKDPDEYEPVKELFETKVKELYLLEDRDSGNYNKFWDERNYLKDVDKIKASVFIIHGINDWNVKTNQCCNLFSALETAGVERRMLLHQGEHVYVYKLKDSNIMKMIEDWLAYYLKGEKRNIDFGTRVFVESNLNQREWYTSSTFPPEGTEMISMPAGGAGLMKIKDDLKSTVYDKASDNRKQWRDELVLSESHAGRLKFVAEPECFDKKRISGACEVSFSASIDKETAILSAMLVDIGDDRRITAEEVYDEAGEFVFGLESEPSPYKIISRGWLNAQNRSSLISKEKIRPGKYYDYKIRMVPTDYTVKQGHKLALIIYGIDADATLRPDTVTEINIQGESIKWEVPFI